MISLKKYLEAHVPGRPDSGPEPCELSTATIECYRAALLAMGKVGTQVCPALGVDLDTSLRGLEHRLAVSYSPESIRRTEKQLEVQLSEWGARTSGHFKAQADEIKELLIALAKTAESVGSKDQGYSSKFNDLTGRLQGIADLNDLREIKRSLVERVKELKSTVEQMTRENLQLVAHLRAEIVSYESKLKSAEHMALKDQLTNVANRRSLEERIQWNIEKHELFSIAMIDLDHFKQVNDTYGHLAGDDLLKQFAAELQSKTRSGDLVGRWGGDEFVVILSGDLTGARAHIERAKGWLFGKYTLNAAGKGPVVIQLHGSIGAAEWREGKSVQELIAEADADMFLDKGLPRQKAS